MAAMAADHPHPVRVNISHPLGNLIGFAMGVTIVFLFLASYSIDWGVGWMVWVPSAIAIIPASHLMRRRILHRRDGYFDLEQGWLMRRARSFPADDLSIELLPTAGLWAVVVHRQGAAWPIATWVTRQRANRVCAVLDGSAPNGAWPRRDPILPNGDR
ncbi:MAG: hypothetical protein EA402_02965 [Planctomycetota bacterium]|nr:MAG: hypothetical protein EA402_02965 [Planctomycetota bacterium]